MKKSTGIAVFIAILFVLFIGFAMNQWYPEPEYPQCNYYDQPVEKPIAAPDGDYIDPCQDVRDQYEQDREAYSKNVALILIVVGLAAVVFGVKGKKFEEYIHIGILWGGILTAIYGIIVYWNYFDDNLKPLLIGALLVGVIYFGNKYKRYLK